MAVGEAISGLFSNPVDGGHRAENLLPETDFTCPVACRSPARVLRQPHGNRGTVGTGLAAGMEAACARTMNLHHADRRTGRNCSTRKAMLTRPAADNGPEEQLYLSRLHDGRYVLHYTDRSYYVTGDF